MARSLIVILSLVFMSVAVSAQSGAYTTEEVLAAYEAGQFRVIHTEDFRIVAASDGTHVAAWNDGVYRISDGVRILDLKQPRFSPDGRYVYQATMTNNPPPEDGIYRLSDGQRMITFYRETYELSHDHRGSYVDVRFSNNGEYVSVSQDGIYHLPDGKKVFDTGHWSINFSPDSTLVATAYGVYPLSDGQQLLALSPRGPESYSAQFSPDGAYAWTDDDGLYRLSDGQKLVDNIVFGLHFSPDMAYAAIGDNGVYRLSDGQRLFQTFGYLSHFTASSRYVQFSTTYDRLYRVSDGELVVEAHDLVISPNEAYVAVMLDGVYRLSDMQKLFDIGGEFDFAWMEFRFSRNSAYLVVSGDGLYRTADGRKILDSAIADGATFSPDSQYLAIDVDGLYRTADGQKLFDIDNHIMNFTPDGAAILVRNTDTDKHGVYRVRDGRKFEGMRLLNVSAGLIAVDDTVMVIERQILRR